MKKNRKVSKSEADILHDYINRKNLKITKQRQYILDTFLALEGHVSAEEIYLKISKKYPSIGLATVYRTMNLFAECGLAQRRQFDDKQTRYEHIFNHTKHDHMICNQCGLILEFENDFIKKLKVKLEKDSSFTVYSHTLELYGTCKKCSEG